MKLKTFAFTCCCLAFCQAVCQAAEWKALITDNTLDNWKAVNGPLESWTLHDGVLTCSGKGGGWLESKEEYGNYELELEFCVHAGGNSGVFLRFPEKAKDPAYDGMEIQILDDHAPEYANLKPTQYTGSIYDVVAASPRVSKHADEWQKMKIVVDGTKVKVELNDKTIVDADAKDHADSLEKHPGLKRERGFVGLQNHSPTVDFRNVKIRELP